MKYITRPDDDTDYQYSVEVSDMPVGAFIWLRNNQVAYSETLRTMPDGVRTVVWFRDEPDAVWFQLKWGSR